MKALFPEIEVISERRVTGVVLAEWHIVLMAGDVGSIRGW